MSSKFKIFTHRQSDSLHLRLIGDFDDISLCELIEILKDNSTDTSRVFIHTGHLNNISVSGIGRDVFKRNLSELNENAMNIQFMGSSDASNASSNVFL